MYYEGLREGIRLACHVRLNVWFREETHQQYYGIERYGRRLWTYVIAEAALIQGHPHALNDTQRYVFEEGDKIIDGILDECDWDTFLDPLLHHPDAHLRVPVPNPNAGTPDDSPQPHPYTAIRTGITPDPKGERRFDVI